MPAILKHKSLVDKIFHWADSPSSDSQEWLQTTKYIARIILITFSEFFKNELSMRAGALTFTILLSLVPILAMSTAIMKGMGGGDQLQRVVYSYIETMNGSNDDIDSPELNTTGKEQIEPESATDHLKSAADQLFAYVDQTDFATLGTIGVLGVFLSVILVFSHIEQAMNRIWKVHSGRSILRKVTDYLTILILLPISINVGFAANTIISNETLLPYAEKIFPTAWVQQIILTIIPLFFIVLTLTVIFIFFPTKKVHTVPAFVGALFAGFFWLELQKLYITMQIGVSKYNAIYGSFATLPLFLLWLFAGWTFILVGAQLTYAIQQNKSHRLRNFQAEPSMKLSAACDIINTVYSFFNRQQVLSPLQLQNENNTYNQNLITQITNQLVDSGILYKAGRNKTILPAAPEEKITMSTIITVIWGEDVPPTFGGRNTCNAIEAAKSSGRQIFQRKMT